MPVRGRQAEKFEEALQRAERGEEVEGQYVPLVRAAQRASMLSAPPPPPPYRLNPGRQRFLAEAASLRAGPVKKERGVITMMRPWKLATALVAALMIFGLVFGAGQAAAASLPGETLYPLKLAVENLMLQLTVDPRAKADLSLDLAEKRLDEIELKLLQGADLEAGDYARVEAQWDAAEKAAFQGQDKAPSWAFLRLYARLYVRKRDRLSYPLDLAEEEQSQIEQIFRNLERKWERARAELHEGVGVPEGNALRAREGEPRDASELPDPADRPGPGPGPVDEPAGPKDGLQPGPGPSPDEVPAGGQPDDAPALGQGQDDPGQAGQGQDDTGPGGEPAGPGQGGAPPADNGSSDDAPGAGKGR
jgi:hypothetical protein